MTMRGSWVLSMACVAVLAAGSARGELSAGSDAPAFEAKECYNTPPLTMEDLEGQVVLLEVFRTW